MIQATSSVLLASIIASSTDPRFLGGGRLDPASCHCK